MLISGIVTQGATYKNAHLFVKSFLLLYSDNGYEWDAIANQYSSNRKVGIFSFLLIEFSA